MFHRAKARLLFLCKRSNPDIQIMIPFLSTRFKEEMDKNRKKLVRVLAYLKGTSEEFLTLSMKDTKLIKWQVRGS